MDEFNTVKIFFQTRNCCFVRVPAHIKKPEKITDFIIDKIGDYGEFENWVEKWIDFEIEDFEVIEEEE